MRILKTLRFSFEAFLVLAILWYLGYYYYTWWADILAYIRTWNYTNGALYLSYFHAFLAYIALVLSFSFVKVLLEKTLKKFLILLTFGHKKEFPIVLNFSLHFFTLVKYLGSLLLASYFVKENYITKDWLKNIQIIVATTIIVYFFSWVVKILLEKKFQKLSSQKSSSASVMKFMNKIIFIVFWIIAIWYILWSFGYNLNALLAWAGIWWLAVALAAQKSITNIFGAITIILNKPFVIWDYVSINGQEGTVKDIGLSYVTLTDRAGHQVMMPNENIITSSIWNFSVRESRRVDFIIWVVYSTSLDKVKLWVETIENLLKNYLEKQKITDDIRVTFDMFNAFSLDIKVTYFSLEGTLWSFNHQKQEINLKIKELFANEGIEMAFPTQEMIIKNEALPVKSIKK